ncbi:MAG: hypothetical protein ACOYYS_25010 [Chloroflexota bacterium]
MIPTSSRLGYHGTRIPHAIARALLPAGSLVERIEGYGTEIATSLASS